MSKRTYNAIASAIRGAGFILAAVGIFFLVFVACCLDSEGAEAIAFLARLTAIGVLMTLAGAVLMKISGVMKERRRGHASRFMY